MELDKLFEKILYFDELEYFKLKEIDGLHYYVEAWYSACVEDVCAEARKEAESLKYDEDSIEDYLESAAYGYICEENESIAEDLESETGMEVLEYRHFQQYEPYGVTIFLLKGGELTEGGKSEKNAEHMGK